MIEEILSDEEADSPLITFDSAGKRNVTGYWPEFTLISRNANLELELYKLLENDRIRFQCSNGSAIYRIVKYDPMRDCYLLEKKIGVMTR